MTKLRLLLISLAVAAGYTITTSYCGVCGPAYTAVVQQFLPKSLQESGG